MPVSGFAPGRPGPGVGERPGTQPARPGQAAGPKVEARPAQAAKPAKPKVKPAGGPNNVLADKNGNVYKRDNQGNMRPAATPATRPATASRPTPRPSVDTRQLNRDYAARQRGEVRTQNFPSASAPRPSVSRPSPNISRPSGGGGGMRGGGGGGGRGGGWRRRRRPRPALGFGDFASSRRTTMASSLIDEYSRPPDGNWDFVYRIGRV